MALRLDQVNGKTQTRSKKEKAPSKAKPRTAKKKAAPVSTAATEAPIVIETSVAAAPPPRPQLRPWSQTGLAKNGQSRKDRLGRDHHMNEEWLNIHEAPLFWVDLSAESKLAAVQEKLMEIERRALALARAPKEIAVRAKTKLKAIFR